MKKIIIFIGALLSTFFIQKNIYAYDFPNDFNYTKAVQGMLNNSINYTDGNYWVSSYPYTGEEQEYQGKYTRNYTWSAPVYAFGIMNGQGNYDCYCVSSSVFQSRRWNVDGSANTNATQGPTNTTMNSGVITGTNTDFNYMITQSGITVNGIFWQMSSTNIANGTFTYNFELYNSWDDFFRTLYENNYNVPVIPPGDSVQTGDLPFLSYTLTRKIVASLQGVLPYGQIKEIFEWDYNEKDPYKSNPLAYTFDIMAYANFKEVTTNGVTETGFDRDNLELNENNRVYLTQGGNNISLNEFSFLYDDVGESVYSHNAPIPWQKDSIGTIKCGYILGIRTCTYDRSQFSWWKLFIVQAGGNVYSTGKVMKPDGTVIDSTADNSNDNMNGGGTTGFSSNNQTTAGGDTTGTVYNDTGQYDISTMISTLKSIVNQLGDIPTMLTQLLTFLPSWFTSILIVSLGLFITIGLVKVIVR